MSGGTVQRCSDCERRWRHCHEVWVLHRDGGECTSADPCDAPLEAHEHVVRCVDLRGACRCD